MTSRKARQIAHALAAEAIRRHVQAVGAYDYLAMSEKDRDRLEKAIEDLAHRHEQYAGYQSAQEIFSP